jgi:hypothetical protein
MKNRTFLPLVLALLFANSYSLVVAQESREEKKTLDLDKDGTLYIDTYKGTIDIKTWDKPQVDITARIVADGGFWDHDEKAKVWDTEIRMEGTSGNVSITTDYSRLRHHSWFFGIFGEDNGSLPLVHYTIMMPATAKLHIKDYKSDTKVSDLSASVDMETYKGSVEFRGITGAVDLETYKGDVLVDFVKLTGDSRFKSEKGSIDIRLPNDVAFNLDTDFGRRVDFDSDFDATVKTQHRHSDSEQASINGGGPTLRLQSEKGNFRLIKKATS